MQSPPRQTIERVRPSEPDEAIGVGDGWHLLSAVAKRRGLRPLALRNLCHRLGVPMRRASRKQVFVRPEELDRALATLPADRCSPSRTTSAPAPREVVDTLEEMLSRRR